MGGQRKIFFLALKACKSLKNSRIRVRQRPKWMFKSIMRVHFYFIKTLTPISVQHKASERFLALWVSCWRVGFIFFLSFIRLKFWCHVCISKQTIDFVQNKLRQLIFSRDPWPCTKPALTDVKIGGALRPLSFSEVIEKRTVSKFKFIDEAITWNIR